MACQQMQSQKSSRCIDCGLHVGQSAYPIVLHFVQPHAKMPILLCNCKAFDKSAAFYCVSCRTPLCQSCRLLPSHNWCKIVTLYCEFHMVPWCGYCCSCNCAFCFYCQANSNVHIGHSLIFFANTLPDLLKELCEIEMNFEKEFEKFQSVLQRIKSYDQITTRFLCESLDKLIAHCFEILTVLILAKTSNDEVRLFWLKRRSRLQLTKIQGKFVELTKDVDKFVSNSTPSINQNHLNTDQSIDQQNMFWRECRPTSVGTIYETNFAQKFLPIANTSNVAPTVYYHNSLSCAAYHNADQTYCTPAANSVCFPPFMQNAPLVATQGYYHLNQSDLYVGQNFGANNYPQNSYQNFSYHLPPNARNANDEYYQNCYQPNEVHQNTFRPMNYNNAPHWSYANFANQSLSVANLSNSSPPNEIPPEVFKSDPSAHSPANVTVDERTSVNDFLNHETEYEKLLKKEIQIEPSDSARSTPKLIIDEDYIEKT